jgi:hypothetical protein
MLKPRLKLRRNKEGRGTEASAFLFARPSLFVRRLGRASRGYVLAGAGVVAAAVGFVSLLSGMAPDSDRPVGSPFEVIERAAGGVLEQVDEQVTALLETDVETSQRSGGTGGVAEAGFKIPGVGESLRKIVAERSASTSPAPPASAAHPSSQVSAPAQERSFSPTKSEPAPQAERETSPPNNTSTTPSSTGGTSPPAAEETPLTTSEPTSSSLAPTTEAPSPTTDEPVSPTTTETLPPATEEPSTPPAEEVPPIEEPSTPPIEEPSTPPAEEPPPTTDRPALPPTQGPPPTQNQPPPPTDQPPSITIQPPPPLAGAK